VTSARHHPVPPSPTHLVRQCLNPVCGLRFPVTLRQDNDENCPACRATTEVAAIYPVGERPAAMPRASGLIVEALLDNVRSIYNVGSMVRTADGAGLRHLHVCGITPPPDHPKIAKTALGAEEAIGWSRTANGLATAVALKSQGCQLWALEGTLDAENLLATAVPPTLAAPLVLVVGSEIAGIDPGILAICDKIVAIPMHGVKNSLNVASAFAIAAYYVCR
jgi:23S rRNA (guanosine2251-2'-O)-methyltransferase